MAANAALVSHVACNPLGIDDSEPRMRWLQSHDEECINIMTEIAGTTQVHLAQDEGDILVFMPGQEDIEVTCETVSDVY